MGEIERTSIYLRVETLELLKTMQHPGQTYDGIIQELIQRVKGFDEAVSGVH